LALIEAVIQKVDEIERSAFIEEANSPYYSIDLNNKKEEYNWFWPRLKHTIYINIKEAKKAHGLE
jgi:hypothetical protein